MKGTNIMVRGAEQVDKINPAIIQAMDRLTPEDTVDIYYTGGLKEKEPKLITDVDKFIGVATNVHKDENGNYVADCTINEFLAASLNFDNVIDNMMVSIKSILDENTGDVVGMIPTVEQFVVYDLNMKRQFDALMETEAQKKVLEGDVPFPRVGLNPLKDKEIQEKIQEDIEQFKKSIQSTEGKNGQN